MIALFAWSAWLIAVVIGLCVFIMRSAETGLTYINLPGFLYYVWIMACALILAHLRAPATAAGRNLRGKRVFQPCRGYSDQALHYPGRITGV